jgi:hypothetical protein
VTAASCGCRAVNLLMIFLALETVSIASYVMVATQVRPALERGLAQVHSFRRHLDRDHALRDVAPSGSRAPWTSTASERLAPGGPGRVRSRADDRHLMVLAGIGFKMATVRSTSGAPTSIPELRRRSPHSSRWAEGGGLRRPGALLLRGLARPEGDAALRW